MPVISLVPLALWAARAELWLQVIEEGNRVIKDITSTEPLLNPSSHTLRLLKENMLNPQNRGGTNHQYVM